MVQKSFFLLKIKKLPSEFLAIIKKFEPKIFPLKHPLKNSIKILELFKVLNIL